MKLTLCLLAAFILLIIISCIAEFLLALYLYNQQMKQLNDGRPKAYYPPIKKPTLFFKRKK